MVSVFGSRVLEAGGLGAEDVAPALLSQKLHKGWVRRSPHCCSLWAAATQQPRGVQLPLCLVPLWRCPNCSCRRRLIFRPATAAVPSRACPLPPVQVSDVQFVSAASSSSAEPPASSSSGGDSLLLLTAGNDGTVCLWDLGRSAEAAGGRGLVPQCLAKATDLHNGEPSCTVRSP